MAKKQLQIALVALEDPKVREQLKQEYEIITIEEMEEHLILTEPPMVTATKPGKGPRNKHQQRQHFREIQKAHQR